MMPPARCQPPSPPAQDARHIDGGAKVHLLAELIAADEAHLGQQADAGRQQPDPGRRHAVHTVRHPAQQRQRQQPAQPFLGGRQRRGGGGLLRAPGRVAEHPGDATGQQHALQDAQHRRVQPQIGQIAQLQPVAALDAASHDQVGHVGRQDGRGQLEGAEAHRQRQPDAATAAGRQADAVGIGQHDGHQQRDAPHVRRHDEGQQIGQRDHAGRHGQVAPARRRDSRPAMRSARPVYFSARPST